jgi:hypothetical protein
MVKVRHFVDNIGSFLKYIRREIQKKGDIYFLCILQIQV